jgi:hypothetical protein
MHSDCKQCSRQANSCFMNRPDWTKASESSPPPPGSVLATGYRELIFLNITRQAKHGADFTQSSKSKEITSEI